MDNQQNQQRIKSLYKMLLEMATGNLAFRVELNGSGDELDQLATMLNDVAEKMQNIISKYEFKNQPYDYNTSQNTTKQSDAELIQKVIDYIHNHLEEPLPTTKELSKMFGTNEFTLKDSFRTIVKTSIYQFYNEERLKKAHFLIEKTIIPLKEIALICGFNDYPNFYKAFKKRYKYPPSELQREKENNNQ
ncbi:helix-turn-helix domain-containing protein [Flavobacterium sp.]|uniref:helix-turn-helix domain-containing protein n=1 Tax=Flavobacterium sp. TaxID=239 RepID=UPI00260B921D|nr:helix-turn-helix domain-containing protein [Flavobacterium sp.]